MNKFNFSNASVCNYVLIGTDTQRIVVIVQNQHLDSGERLYTAIDENPDGINIYTEKISDLSERYDIPKEELLLGIKSAGATLTDSNENNEGKIEEKIEGKG